MGIARKPVKGNKLTTGKVVDILHEEICKALTYLGEQCVARIRDRGADESWIDRTGNLRSSIGYGVYDKGKEYMTSAFETVLSGSSGSTIGKSRLNALSALYADTYSLVVVAGMSYAGYVEAIENKDVLDSTRLWAATEVGRYVRKAMEKAVHRIIKE